MLAKTSSRSSEVAPLSAITSDSEGTSLSTIWIDLPSSLSRSSKVNILSMIFCARSASKTRIDSITEFSICVPIMLMISAAVLTPPMEVLRILSPPASTL
ncbi:MAG: hypothetical protein A3B67_06265 [Burkholderiales bacterium RIFCSPHIGHO2_02_FULL_66_10]|nr:MAG: hypothetical protein A3B67_06265 [Burkholderiales bacterium RIFCSPHIGHO2_02_FULL_66_10]